MAVPAGYKEVKPKGIPQGYKPVVVEETRERRGLADELLRQVGLTARAGTEGIASTAGIVLDPLAIPIRGAINLFLDEKIPVESFQNLVNRALTKAGVPEPETKTEEIIQNISQVTAGAGGFAGGAKKIADLSSKGLSKIVAGKLASGPGTQLAGAATGQASAELARESGGSPLVQAGASLVGGIAGAGTVSKLGRVPSATDDVAEATTRGIRVLTSDVKTPKTFASKWLQGAGEKIPYAGTGPVRAAQQVERIYAIKNTLREFGADDIANASDDIMSDLLKTRGKMISKFTKVKDAIFRGVKDAGKVPVKKTIDIIDDEISKLSRLDTKELNPAIERLTDWKSAIQNKNIDDIELLRKQLGETFSSPELTSVKGTAQKSLNNIYRAVRDDIGDFILENGNEGDFLKWKNANKNLSDMMGELGKAALKSALNKGTVTPEAVRGLLFSKKISDVKSLYQNLSPAACLA